MSIREAVARAIGKTRINGRYLVGPNKADYSQMTDVAITAFLKAAAAKGWYMRSDETTQDMRAMGEEARTEEKTASYIYRIMLFAGPSFEWDK